MKVREPGVGQIVKENVNIKMSVNPSRSVPRAPIIFVNLYKDICSLNG